MPLNKQQRSTLLRTKEFRDKPLPIIGSMLRSWKIHLLLTVLIGGDSFLFWYMGFVKISIACLGVLIGALIRDLAWFRTQARLWPMNCEIINWEKVDKLLQEENLS